MRFSFVYMGLYAGMGVLSSVCASTDYIKDHINSSQNLTLPNATDTESASSDPSLFTSVTITGVAAGTTIRPVTGGGAFPLFDSSTNADPSKTAQNLTLSNVTVRGFKAAGTSGYGTGGGAITTTSDTSYDSTKTVNLIASGPIIFSNNDASTVNVGGGAIFANTVAVSGSVNGSVTFTGNQAVHGGAICTRSAIGTSGTINLNSSGANFVSVTFNGNKAIDSAEIGGGAICTGTLTAGGTSQLTFTGNTAASRGGAIYTVGNVNLACPTTFSTNTAVGSGGAIYAEGNVALTDTQFTGNSVTPVMGRAQGGAVFVSGDFTYTISSGNIVLNPALSPTLGDNDIACGGAVSTFNKNGPGTLVLNTNNSGWLGSTNINAGRLTVGLGNSHSSAVWGPDTGATGTFTVNNGGTLRGYGTINTDTFALDQNLINTALSNFNGTIKARSYALSISSGETFSSPLPAPGHPITGRSGGTLSTFDSLIFQSESIWNVSLTNPLNINGGTLTLTPGMQVQLGASRNPFAAAGYTVASYNELSGSGSTAGASTTAILAPLNVQLAGYNLMLTASSGSITLIKLPSGLYLRFPLAQHVLVNFEVPGFVNGRAITKDLEGLLVRYGPPRIGNVPMTSYFEGGDQNYSGQILLNNHDKTSVLLSGIEVANDLLTPVRPLSWTGSTALPLGRYAWQLWKTTGYTDLSAKDGQGGRLNGGWVAQGSLDLTRTDLLSVTYQIDPGEGSES